MYHFPKDEIEKEKWIKAIPKANLRVSKDAVVCAIHSPSDFEVIKVNGKSRPKYPPSIWPGVQYNLVKYQHQLYYHDPQKKFVQPHVALRKINYQSFSVVISNIYIIKGKPKKQRESLVHLSCFIIEDTLYVQSQ